MVSRAVRQVEKLLIVDPAEAVLAVFAREDYEPPMLPAAALQIHELTRRAKVDPAEIVRVLERDPMLAADFLRHADSPVFATRHGVTGLHDAIVRMGLNTVERIVWEIAFGGTVFRSRLHGPMMESFRQHSVATAKVACVIAEKVGLEGEPVFLAGLLHDVGVAAVLMVHETLAREDRNWLTVELGPCLARSHEQAGAAVCDSWGLPEAVSDIAGAHHVSVTQPDLRGCVAVADAMVHMMLEGLPAELALMDSSAQLCGAWLTLGLDPSDLTATLESVKVLARESAE